MGVPKVWDILESRLGKWGTKRLSLMHSETDDSDPRESGQGRLGTPEFPWLTLGAGLFWQLESEEREKGIWEFVFERSRLQCGSRLAVLAVSLI